MMIGIEVPCPNLPPFFHFGFWIGDFGFLIVDCGLMASVKCGVWSGKLWSAELVPQPGPRNLFRERRCTIIASPNLPRGN